MAEGNTTVTPSEATSDRTTPADPPVTPSEYSSGEDRRERLGGLERAIRAAVEAHQFQQQCQGILIWVYCEDCYEPELRGKRATRCRACQEKYTRERRCYQQWQRRRLASGLLVRKDTDVLRLVGTAPRTCGHCGGEFLPEHTTARYCSAKCRMAAHRLLK
jgi:hypothetical protein